MELFEVGGCVRDEILGVRSKDIDFSVVLEDADLNIMKMMNDIQNKFMDPFGMMVFNLKEMGFNIFLETPEHLTVRARFPTILKDGHATADPNGIFAGRHFNGLTADFVLSRKEGTYSDGRRPDSVTPGDLMDDLMRRDFTMNAIAKDSSGRYIDPFNGQRDIHLGIIRAVGDPFDRLTEDALRAVRALRFSVTKRFVISADLQDAMQNAAVLKSIEKNISDERIQAELSKMFRFDTVASLAWLSKFPLLTRAMFSGRVSLDSTLKTKGRGR